MKFSEIGEALTGQPMFEMFLRGQELERQGRDILHMELGDPDFSAPSNIIDAVTRAMKDGVTHYVDSRGLPQFRDAIRHTLKNDFRLDCDLGQVVVTPGANSGIYWVLRCLLNPGDEVLIPDPGFPSFRAAAKAASVKVIPINCDRSNNFSLDLTEVEAAITPRSKLLIVNSPSNPTGFAMSEKTLDSIYTIAEKHNLYVLSDDTYRRMTYETEFSPSITKYDDCKKRTILLSGLSKEYSLSGFRLGYLVGPEELMSKVTLYIQTVNSCVAPFIQMGGVEAFLGDQKIRKDNLQILKLRSVAMVAALNLIPGIECHSPDGGLYVFPNVKGTGFTGDQFAKFVLEHAGIVCVSGSAFGAASTDHVRLSLNAPIDILQSCAQRISVALTGHSN